MRDVLDASISSIEQVDRKSTREKNRLKGAIILDGQSVSQPAALRSKRVKHKCGKRIITLSHGDHSVNNRFTRSALRPATGCSSSKAQHHEPFQTPHRW